MIELKLLKAVENLQALLDVLDISKKEICPHRLANLDDALPACLPSCVLTPSSLHLTTPNFQKGRKKKKNKCHISISSIDFILSLFMAAILQGWILANSLGENSIFCRKVPGRFFDGWMWRNLGLLSVCIFIHEVKNIHYKILLCQDYLQPLVTRQTRHVLME